MSLRRPFHRFVALLLFAAASTLAGWASADPPTRVARLGYINGAVSFSPAGENDWVLAVLNRPLVTGDRLWTDAAARAELQVGSAAIRIGADTSVTLLNMDDRVTQLQLAQGTLNVHVRRLAATEVLEIDTPNLAATIRRPGDYRIDVDPAGDATIVVTRNGQAEVFGEGATYAVDARAAYRFFGTGLRDYDSLDVPPADEFDQWCFDRDRSWQTSVSARYVSPDVIGYQDLDEYGSWRVDPGYGNVWMPSRVAAGWAPYQDGHWAWVEPWGWTWVDDAPWGFAVSHYGRWAHLQGGWGWVPGPVRARAIYAPALVAFVGGGGFGFSISGGGLGIGWFPLGPRDVYRPGYRVSRGYFNNINTSNTIINNVTITNVYNNRNVTNITYANRNVPGAVIAVPANAFAQSQHVGRAAVRVSRESIADAPVTAVATVAPVAESVRGAARPGRRPPEATLTRPAVARNAPPAAPVGFASKQSLLAANPGQPLDPAALGALKPAAPRAESRIKVVAPSQTAGPATAPPPQREQRTQPEQRGQREQRGKAEDRAAPAGASAQPQAVVPPPAAAPPASRVQPDQRGQPEQRGQRDQRGQPGERMTPVPGGAAPQTPAPPAATPPAARGQPDQRQQPEQRGQRDQRGQPESRMTPAPGGAAPQTPAPPPAATPPAARGQPDQRQQPDQRGQREQRAAPAPSGAVPQAVAPPPAARPVPPPPVTPQPALRPVPPQPVTPQPAVRPAAPPAVTPVPAAPPAARPVPPTPVPAAPVAAPAEARGKADKRAEEKQKADDDEKGRKGR